MAVKRKDASSLSAVIAGGSISGLLSAHVLGPYVDSITIIDQDDVSWMPRIQNVVLGEVNRISLFYHLMMMLWCAT